MEKSKLYTRSGDKGMTSLAGGKKVPKTDLRLEAYGTVDELNSHLGLLIAMIPDEKGADIRNFLINVQHNLLNLGTRLATPRDYWPKIAARYSLPQDAITGLEQAIDRIEEKLPSQRTFILPGGALPAAQAQVCRTVCRRAERRIQTLNSEDPLEPEIPAYINRLSDYLFVLARNLNSLTQTEEILWSNI